ncbi:MAG TPA: hypothetical protein VNX23_01270 [Bradyrhizobium sp.]|uniref:hypothetical protein n=1 Tax=Bradyrhizobium sp. TaxID=376 RepID=UPI002BD060EF|nr:hypothetical protein [Bradyrhizobium sp.]HXB76035.1 hypothetical protein [Bradyrhizobium sp.]
MTYDSDEYRKLMEQRFAAGELINPATAEVARWHANYFDPYGDGLELSDEAVCHGRQLFVRPPEVTLTCLSMICPRAHRMKFDGE